MTAADRPDADRPRTIDRPTVPTPLGRLEHEPLGPGVGLDEVDFAIAGERVAPFHMATFWVDPGAVSEVDRHQVRETWYVLAGEATLTSDGHSQQIRAGDVIYLESLTPHQLHNRSAERLYVLALWW